ncbi:MAG: phosphoglucosamine mutase [Synergistaceae bacterium]
MADNTKRTRKYFGTDGVRDIANTGNMTPEFALMLGRAYGLFVKRTRLIEKPKIVIGRDTRFSGTMILSALATGLNSVGVDVTDIGVIPTPGVSFVLAHNEEFQGGAVISASHNPAEYNGIKFLDHNGFKLTDENELEIEDNMLLDFCENRPTKSDLGQSDFSDKYANSYLNELKKLFISIAGTNKKIVVDSANGAASEYVEKIYSLLKSETSFIANNPNGMNINAMVGVTHMNTLIKETCAKRADLGIAYDGDADRILMCDSKGRIIDGDIMLWVLARWMFKNNKLGSGVVATVMSNMVLEDLLKKDGIKVFRCGVGDRYVLDKMREKGSLLGGEQSGHIIALDHANTGDGISSGILFLKAVEELGDDISDLVDNFDRYPQVLTNVIIKDKEAVLSHPLLLEAVEEAERLLGKRGRMLLRPSGTEPMIRIFVESRDQELMNFVAKMLEDVIKSIVC